MVNELFEGLSLQARAEIANDLEQGIEAAEDASAFDADGDRVQSWSFGRATHRFLERLLDALRDMSE